MFKPVNSNINFPELETSLLEKWYKEGIIDKYLKKNSSSKKKFSFLDGPITANNPMGVHHAWGRTYKDLWQRFWNMRGKKERFQNGFDEQGLWVEVEVEKELGLKNKKDIENLVAGNKFKSIEKFINLCKERVKKFSAIQTEQSKRLGYFMDWDNSYHTSSNENNYAIWNFIKVVNEKGWLYKGRDSVPWCPRCGTAISQHEISTEEYKEITHETVLFKLPVLNEDYSLLVWTTTPWTIPANVAVAVNPNFKYRIWKYRDEKLVIVSPDEIRKKGKKSEYDAEKFQWYEDNIMKGGFEGIVDIEGKDLVGKKYKGPFDSLPRVKKAQLENPNNFHTIIAAEELVVGNKGTGLLHIAPAAGEEDFQISKKENLPVIEVIDEEASYLENLGELSKKNAKKHPELIIDFLKTKDGGCFLLDTPKIAHRYPTCWRCKTELVWRAVNEWYISMDKKDESGKTYREQMMEVAKKITYLPDWGLDRELDWLKNMHDWLISKKRYWGLALPVWECKECKTFEVIGNEEDLKARAVKGWDKFKGNSPHRPWIDEIKIKCWKCSGVISRIPDVGNPWLDAGIVPFSTMPQDWFPADFITESFPGQFRNWFYSLIAMSTVLKKTNSFKTVLGFASVRDEKGEEMHKSKGNAIEFNEAASKIGADIMRWLYVTQNPETNLNFGYGPATEVKRRFYLILWNCYKFFVDYAGLFKWDHKDKARDLKILDKWILAKLARVVLIVNNSLEKYDATTASRSIGEFILNDFSTWYIRRSRERVGFYASVEERSTALSIMYEVLVTLSKLLAPFVPFITEEIYRNLTGRESVHLENYPKVDKKLIDKELEEEMRQARKVVEAVHATRKFHNIKLRQPLKGFSYSISRQLSKEMEMLMAEETNVKNVTYESTDSKLETPFISLDKNLSGDLIAEGDARNIVRKIQEERKRLGTELNEKVDVVIEDYPLVFEDYIKRKASVGSITRGLKFLVTRK